MSLFKKGKLGKKSGDDGAEEGANPDIEAEAEAHAAADAEIGAAEAQAEAGGAQPSAAAPQAGGADTGAMPPAGDDPLGGGNDDLGFDDDAGGGDFDDFDDDYMPQPSASKKKFVVAAVGLLVLAGGSFALMSMMGGSDGPPPPQPPSQQVADTTQPPGQPPAPGGPDGGMPGGDAAPALPMPTPSQNTDTGPDKDLAMDGTADLPPLSAPGAPPETAMGGPDDAPLPAPMPPGDDAGGLGAPPAMPGMEDGDVTEMADAGMEDDMMSPPGIPGLDGGPDMDDGGMDMAAGPDDMMAPPDIPGLSDAPDTGDAPEMPGMDMPGEDMAADTGEYDARGDDLPMPGLEDDGGMLDELDNAMEGGMPPAPSMDDVTDEGAGDDMDAGEDGEKTLAETLGADLAPLEVEDGEAQMPADDDLAALMNAPADDGLGDELDLLEELDQAGPADAGISGAADDVVDTGRTRGRLNLDDLDAEPQLTPVFPRNTSKYLKVEKDYSSSSVRSQVESAQRALKNGRDSLALELFDALYVKHPRDPRIMMGRAVALQKNGMIEEAVDAYEKVLNRDPRNVNALTNMLGLIRMTDPDRALTKLLDLKATYPGRPSILAQLGMTYADVGDEESAMRYLNMAQELEPEDPRHAFNMAVLMDRRGQTPQAIMNYKRALFLNSNAGGNLVPASAIQQRLDALR